MSLWEDSRQILHRLASCGWKEIFARHGLDLAALDDQTDCLRRLPNIDRRLAGFEDFATSGVRALEPGDPARSLIYHALASPHVHPEPVGRAPNADDYPSLVDLDLIENLIYALGRTSIAPAGLTPAVFAYEYRPADRTPHGRHADLVFSRMAIARNGDQPAAFDPITRSFRQTTADPRSCRVMPARYAVFLARRLQGDEAFNGSRRAFALMGGGRRGGDDRSFLLPVHKLFAGDDCLDGAAIQVDIRHRHVNEKLARACSAHRGVRVESGFDLAAPPFREVTEDHTPGGALPLRRYAGCAVLSPKPGPLIQEAKQSDPKTGVSRLVAFQTPRQTTINLLNRRYTSLRIADDWAALANEGIEDLLDNLLPWLGVRSGFPRPRNAPEFMNIRHKVENGTIAGDMLQTPHNRSEFRDQVADGGYAAAMFVDGCADGCISAEIRIVDKAPTAVAPRPTLRVAKPAFSVVAPPDFFPSVDQVELYDWLAANDIDSRSQFRLGAPDPLCFGRLPPNPDVVDPVTGQPAFSDRDSTQAAIVAAAPRGGKRKIVARRVRGRTSFLPDASSNVFAPGWDVTYAANDGDGPFFATYGLGSPFPEDVKLCAAANSFWPAVSPDAARTFGRTDAPTAIPLMDSELGYHVDHPWVCANLVTACDGWDGERGPFLMPDGEAVNYADIWRSDYVANIRDGRFAFNRFADIDANEMIARIAALRAAIGKADKGASPARTTLLLVSAEPVANWEAAAPDAKLVGSGYRFLFARMVGDPDDAWQTTPGRLSRAISSAVRARIAGKQVRLDKATPGRGALDLYRL